ncbi:MAG: hypothetical protein EBX40_08125 [Gammaproteobacteria bacterium]|nr:hypothetical protein [Gammaproteobacteria bacterium]
MVGILLITHGEIGKELLQTARRIVTRIQAPIDHLKIEYSYDVQSAIQAATEKVTQLDEGDGVLILSDLYGATPYNIANAVMGHRIFLVSGLNLPMLLRAVSYPKLSLEQLAEKAAEGGHIGITCRKDAHA